MKRGILLLMIFLMFSLITGLNAQDTLQSVFGEYGYKKGAFVLLDPETGKYFYMNKPRCSERFLPASTYKIPNSLIALESGVVPDKNFKLKWDGVKRSFEAHNQDQTLETAMKYSALWYFQEIARRVGRETAQKFLNEFNYGNMIIGDQIDLYWVDGSLKISPEEQVEFLRKLYMKELPVSDRTLETVKEIMTLEEDKATGLRLMAKTGWGDINGVNYGWFVGICEYQGRTAVFALNIEAGDPAPGTFIQDRINISKEILSDLNYYPKDKLTK